LFVWGLGGMSASKATCAYLLKRKEKKKKAIPQKMGKIHLHAKVHTKESFTESNNNNNHRFGCIAT
jgi:hypothetical protein